MNFIRDRRDAVRRANEDLRNRDGGMDDEDSFASSAKSTQPWHELKANAAADLGAILGELAPPRGSARSARGTHGGMGQRPPARGRQREGRDVEGSRDLRRGDG